MTGPETAGSTGDNNHFSELATIKEPNKRLYLGHSRHMQNLLHLSTAPGSHSFPSLRFINDPRFIPSLTDTFKIPPRFFLI